MKKTLTALRLLRKTKRDTNSASEVNRFLEAASTDDEVLFYTVFKYFEERGEITQEHQSYQNIFNKKFLSADLE